MKRILTAAALLLVVAACNKDENYNDKYGDRAVIPPKGQSLRVMTYNIYGARATSPANAADLDAIAEVIRRQNPDFVTLNEVDVFTNRTGKDVHQARDLAEKLGMEWHFSKAIDRDGGEYGDAVLSKYPILEKRSYRLPCAAEQPGEDRSLCVIRVQIDGKDLYVASTHLDHLSGDASRLVQATEIRRIRDTELEGDLILCGDLNVAHTEQDIKNAKTNRMSAGFTDQERAKMTELLAAGFADSFRVVHPDEVKYSWWSYRFHAREKNAGWRIDYFIVSQRIADKIRAAEIHNEVFGSDHCPVELDIDL